MKSDCKATCVCLSLSLVKPVRRRLLLPLLFVSESSTPHPLFSSLLSFCRDMICGWTVSSCSQPLLSLTQVKGPGHWLERERMPRRLKAHHNYDCFPCSSLSLLGSSSRDQPASFSLLTLPLATFSLPADQ